MVPSDVIMGSRRPDVCCAKPLIYPGSEKRSYWNPRAPGCRNKASPGFSTCTLRRQSGGPPSALSSERLRMPQEESTGSGGVKKVKSVVCATGLKRSCRMNKLKNVELGGPFTQTPIEKKRKIKHHQAGTHPLQAWCRTSRYPPARRSAAMRRACCGLRQPFAPTARSVL